MFPGFPAADSTFLSWFHSGSYAYAGEDQNGFSIRWRDDAGVMWGTDLSSGLQANSTFVIDQVKVVTNIDYTIKVLAHFNCILYNAAGETKTLTDGKYVGEFSNF